KAIDSGLQQRRNRMPMLIPLFISRDIVQAEIGGEIHNLNAPAQQIRHCISSSGVRQADKSEIRLQLGLLSNYQTTNSRTRAIVIQTGGKLGKDFVQTLTSGAACGY